MESSVKPICNQSSIQAPLGRHVRRCRRKSSSRSAFKYQNSVALRFLKACNSEDAGRPNRSQYHSTSPDQLVARIVSDHAESLRAPLRFGHLAVISQNALRYQILFVTAKARSPTLSLRPLLWIVEDAPFLLGTASATTLSLRTAAITAPTTGPTPIVLIVTTASPVSRIQAPPLLVALALVAFAAALGPTLRKGLV